MTYKEFKLKWINDPEVEHGYQEVWTLKEIEADFIGEQIVKVLKKLAVKKSAIWISEDESTFITFTRCK